MGQALEELINTTMDREAENVARRCTKALFFDSLRTILSSCENGVAFVKTSPQNGQW